MICINDILTDFLIFIQAKSEIRTASINFTFKSLVNYYKGFGKTRNFKTILDSVKWSDKIPLNLFCSVFIIPFQIFMYMAKNCSVCNKLFWAKETTGQG